MGGKNQPSILVIEDEKPLANIITAKLAHQNFKIHNSSSVLDSYDILKKKAIDVIWLDHYLLGQENGLDLVHKIKNKDSQFREIPIFVVSNTASPEKAQTYLRLGVNKFYTKVNHSLEEIIEDIKDCLGQNTKFAVCH
jgi:CheY-like chemotaxis protein